MYLEKTNYVVTCVESIAITLVAEDDWTSHIGLPKLRTYFQVVK